MSSASVNAGGPGPSEAALSSLGDPGVVLFGFWPSEPAGYALGEVIGKGAFGRVFRSTLAGSNEENPLAVKVVGRRTVTESSADDSGASGQSGGGSAAQAAQQEGRLLLRLQGAPGIIRCHACFASGSEVWLVMELGRATLHQASRPSGVTEAELRPWAVQLANGLCALHELGWVHLDVKPANVVLVGNEAKLIDLGLAELRQSHSGPASTLYQQAGNVKPRGAAGTASYYGPEVHAAEVQGRPTPTTAAQDAWGLGVTLLSALLGRNPFSRDGNEAATRAAVLGGFAGCDLSGRTLSPAAIHLLRVLLRSDPVRRLRCDEVVAHPWASAFEGGPTPSRQALARAERRHTWSKTVVRQRIQHCGTVGAQRGSIALSHAPALAQKVLMGVGAAGSLLVARGA